MTFIICLTFNEFRVIFIGQFCWYAQFLLLRSTIKGGSDLQTAPKPKSFENERCLRVVSGSLVLLSCSLAPKAEAICVSK